MKYILLTTALLFSSIAFGQRGEGRSDERRENIESMRVAYITKEMSLSAEDAQVFWPIMNKYEEQFKSMRGSAKKRSGEEITDLTESDAKKLYTQRLNTAQTRIDLTKQLVSELEQHLTSVQILNYLKAEDNFKKEVLGKVRERMGERRLDNQQEK